MSLIQTEWICTVGPSRGPWPQLPVVVAICCLLRAPPPQHCSSRESEKCPLARRASGSEAATLTCHQLNYKNHPLVV